MLNKNNIHIPHWKIGVIALLMFLVDRFYWAEISQWREDQATNIWLGYTARLGHMPVGLITSADIPNPNGMVFLGFFLSLLPNLLTASFFLGAVQIFLLALAGFQSSGGDRRFFLLAALPTLSSVVLRSTSVEFWNQYTVTLINILFIFLALRYLENASLWNLPLIVFLILLAPALYLAGIATSLAMLLITLGIIAYKRPELNQFQPVLFVILLLIAASIFLTWIPYFQNVSLAQITAYNETSLGLGALLRAAWNSIFFFPAYIVLQWANASTLAFTFKHADPRILSNPAEILMTAVGGVYLLQVLFAFMTFVYAAFVGHLKNGFVQNMAGRINPLIAKAVLLSGLFIILSYTFSISLGGPDWIRGERPDQTVQLLPMFLIFIFLLPFFWETTPTAQKRINQISSASLIIFTSVNLACGFLIIRDHLQYRGGDLTEADVPLIDKMQAIAFVASDWRQYSNSDVVPLDYDIGGNWDWVSEYGFRLTRWYPAPMTEGRALDYELLRRYGLKNQQEGVQLRTFGSGRYLMTYAFNDPPQVEDGKIVHHTFGRLRVSVVEK